MGQVKVLKCLTCGAEQFLGNCSFTHYADCNKPLMVLEGKTVDFDSLKCDHGDRVVHERDGA